MKSRNIAIVIFALVGLGSTVVACAPPLSKGEAPIPAKTDYARVPSKGCSDADVASSRFRVTQERDTIDNYTAIRSAFVINGNIVDDHNTWTISRYDEAQGSKYSLHIGYYARDWLSVDAGQSLTVIADGQRIDFSGGQSTREVESGGIYEGLSLSNNFGPNKTARRSGGHNGANSGRPRGRHLRTGSQAYLRL